MLHFSAERMKFVVELLGCLDVVAVRAEAADLANKCVGMILSGGNMDIRLQNSVVEIAGDGGEQYQFKGGDTFVMKPGFTSKEVDRSSGLIEAYASVI